MKIKDGAKIAKIVSLKLKKKKKYCPKRLNMSNKKKKKVI